MYSRLTHAHYALYALRTTHCASLAKMVVMTDETKYGSTVPRSSLYSGLMIFSPVRLLELNNGLSRSSNLLGSPRVAINSRSDATKRIAG